MKLFKLSLIILMLPMTSRGESKKNDPYLIGARKVIMYRTIRWYHNEDGVNRLEEDFDKYLYSAYRVSEMFPVYPAKNQKDRMLKYFSFGPKETGCYPKNFVVFNVPGFPYPGLPPGHLVKNFSTDYSWCGDNTDNLLWCYDIAYHVQNELPLPNYLNLTEKTKKELKKCHIPKDLKLKSFTDEELLKPKLLYKIYKKKHFRAAKIRHLLIKAYETGEIKYTEDTQDDIDSMLIYRILIELDRKNKGWGYENYNKSFYNYISKYLK